MAVDWFGVRGVPFTEVSFFEGIKSVRLLLLLLLGLHLCLKESTVCSGSSSPSGSFYNRFHPCLKGLIVFEGFIFFSFWGCCCCSSPGQKKLCSSSQTHFPPSLPTVETTSAVGVR